MSHVERFRPSAGAGGPAPIFRANRADILDDPAPKQKRFAWCHHLPPSRILVQGADLSWYPGHHPARLSGDSNSGGTDQVNDHLRLHHADDAARRRELADFLRTRRARLRPEDVGLPAAGRRRTPGLRREELAQLAGVGITWYTWLEQARDIRVSPQVLESLARALGLRAEEQAHLFDLAQGASPRAAGLAETVNPALQRVLDQQEPSPAYILGRRWDLLAWNSAARRVFRDFADLPEGFRNIVWYMFTDATLRRLLIDWEHQARRQLAQFRASSARHTGDPAFTRLITALMDAAPEFRLWWPHHDVLGRPEARKDLDHPRVGRLALEQTTFHVDTNPDLRLVLYTPLPEDDTEEKLALLAAPGA